MKCKNYPVEITKDKNTNILLSFCLVILCVYFIYLGVYYIGYIFGSMYAFIENLIG